MTNKDKIAFLETNLSRILSLISSADTKIATFFAIDSAMLGVLVALMPSPNVWTIFPGLMSLISSILLSISIAMLAAAAFPRIKGPKQSIIYFKGISDREEGQYMNAIKDISEDSYLKDLSRQCHRNAEIATAKYHWIKYAAFTLFIGCPFWLLSIFSLYKIGG